MNGKRQRSLQQAGLAFTDAKQQHRDDGSCRERDLLGRLGGEIGPGEAGLKVEGRREDVSRDMECSPKDLAHPHLFAKGYRTHPVS